MKTDQHLYFDGHELLDEDATLQTLGIPQGAHLLLKVGEVMYTLLLCNADVCAISSHNQCFSISGSGCTVIEKAQVFKENCAYLTVGN